ncbi:IS66 family transposase [Bradyrhizobium sp. CCGUVB1N3]|nr:IS66 family transposase [Bradyrhizobium sp. CCGUVB1N3]MCP3476618.1 IS66 family transposase [Bradyrhizobium sp. CCGUVB1N3]
MRGLGAGERRAARQAETKPLMEALKARLIAVKDGISRRSTLIKAIDYMLERWQGLMAFLDDGRIEPDSNTVERSIRPIAIGKKNSLFSGDDEGASYYPSVYLLIIQGISGWRRKTTDCGAIACERHLGARPVA